MKYPYSLLFILVAFLYSPPQSFAQTSQNGIVVSPSLIRLDLAIDPPEYLLQYSNNTENTVVLTFRAQDFTELEDGWKVRFLEPKDAQNYRYSLSSWINFNKKSLTLSPDEKGEIMVTIDDRNLSPGGHYASILAEIEQQTSDEKVALRGILSSLLFVRTHTGKEHEEASITSFRQLQDFFQFPQQLIFRLKNSGNVELTPYGTIVVKDPLGTTILKQPINEESYITLPETIRRYDIALKKPDVFLLPGMYKAQLSVRYGKEDNKIHEDISFFSLGSIQLWQLLLLSFSIITMVYVMRKKRGVSKK